MNPLTTSAFDLPDHLSAKADPTLIAAGPGHGDLPVGRLPPGAQRTSAGSRARNRYQVIFITH
ncbi:MAG: hypothetical protein ACRD0O_06440 [Acidimicrobiia bacterium]